MPRPTCLRCQKPLVTCHCAVVRPFYPETRFLILIHPKEAKNAVGSARLAHQVLANSLLVEGEAFADHPGVTALLTDPAYFPVLLYPGPDSHNLTETPIRPPSPLLVVVIDGTWRQSRKMLRLSPNLQALPKVSFTTPHPSRFRIRKQPKPFCFSTIEAIHQVLDLESPPARDHDNLLQVFDFMVETQLKFRTLPGHGRPSRNQERPPPQAR